MLYLQPFFIYLMKGVTFWDIIWWSSWLIYRVTVYKPIFSTPRYRAYCLCTKEHNSLLEVCLPYRLLQHRPHPWWRKTCVSALCSYSILFAAHIPLNFLCSIIKNMFATNSTTSLTSLSYGVLLDVIVYHFAVDCSGEQSKSRSKPFDKNHHLKKP